MSKSTTQLSLHINSEILILYYTNKLIKSVNIALHQSIIETMPRLGEQSDIHYREQEQGCDWGCPQRCVL